MLQRSKFLSAIVNQFKVHPVCALLGPRQCGKTTLALQYAGNLERPFHHFDLENPEDVLSLQEPMRVLENLPGLVVIDEIQRLPDVFPILRVLADKQTTKYLILGSASRDLIQQSSETLAGRIGYIELTPFQLAEGVQANKLMMRGGFPRSYLAQTDADSSLWREAFIQTFLERDIPNLGFNIPALILRRFWMMLTHVHGQLINMSQLGTALGVSGHTIRHYLDILAGTFMIRLMPPWFENIGKRQIKTPKLFFRDNGLLLTLLGIQSEEALLRHPYRGVVWEGFAMEQVIQFLNLRPEEAFFWRTHEGAELDLLAFCAGKRIGYEFKFTDRPATTKSMHQALADLKLEHLYVVYPGQRTIPLTDNITAIGLVNLIKPSQNDAESIT